MLGITASEHTSEKHSFQNRLSAYNCYFYTYKGMSQECVLLIVVGVTLVIPLEFYIHKTLLDHCRPADSIIKSFSVGRVTCFRSPRYSTTHRTCFWSLRSLLFIILVYSSFTGSNKNRIYLFTSHSNYKRPLTSELCDGGEAYTPPTNLLKSMV